MSDEIARLRAENERLTKIVLESATAQAELSKMRREIQALADGFAGYPDLMYDLRPSKVVRLLRGVLSGEYKS